MRLKTKGIILLIFLGICLMDCRKKPPTGPDGSGGDDYDPRNISKTENASGGPHILTDASGTIHVVWTEADEKTPDWSQNREAYYLMKPPGGEWTTLFNISNTSTMSNGARFAIDPTGNIHVVWEEYLKDPYNEEIYYRMRKSDGNWTEIENISNTSAWSNQSVIVGDPSGTIYTVWVEDGKLVYSYKTSGISWSPFQEILPFGYGPNGPSITVSHTGKVHISYDGLGDEEIYYVTGTPTSWSEPVNISNSQWYSTYSDIIVDIHNTVWVVWGEYYGHNKIYYAYKLEDGEWSIPDTIPGITGGPTLPKVRSDQESNIHFMWNEERNGNWEIYHRVLMQDGSWSEEENISNTESDSYGVDFTFGPEGIYVVWGENTNDDTYEDEIYFDIIPWQ